MKTETVKVNGVTIECPFENGENYIAVKAICEALGIDHQKQYERIKNDRKLSQLYTDTVYSCGADGKQRQMFCIPLKYVFGWLFSIDETKINETSRENFIKYKDECYEVLYNHFFNRAKRQLEANEIEIHLLEEINELNEQKNRVSSDLKEKKAKLDKIREERLKNEPSLFD
jgi:hypothetical protein